MLFVPVCDTLTAWCFFSKVAAIVLRAGGPIAAVSELTRYRRLIKYEVIVFPITRLGVLIAALTGVLCFVIRWCGCRNLVTCDSTSATCSCCCWCCVCSIFLWRERSSFIAVCWNLLKCHIMQCMNARVCLSARKGACLGEKEGCSLGTWGWGVERKGCWCNVPIERFFQSFEKILQSLPLNSSVNYSATLNCSGTYKCY